MVILSGILRINNSARDGMLSHSSFGNHWLGLFVLLLSFSGPAGTYCHGAGSTANGIPVKSPTNSVSELQREMVYTYNGPESPMDHRYDYHWRVLRTALDKTIPKYGPYRAEAANFMTEERQAFELKQHTAKLTVIIRGDSMDFEKDFEAVWIPVDKGLLGYRLFLIRREDQRHFTADTTLENLRNYSIGQGSGWKDIDILRGNGFKVEAGGEYAGLFAMLANGRFDLFSRGVEEVMDEYSLHKQKLTNLTIETNLMLYYPIARYFWFPKSDHGKGLAQRVREGMTMMVEDGALDRMFEGEHLKLFDELHLKTRKLFVLKNPLAAPEVPLGDKRLWYSPYNGKQSEPKNGTAQPRRP